MDIRVIPIPRFLSYAELRDAMNGVTETYIALTPGAGEGEVSVSPRSLDRMAVLLEQSGTVMVYSDYFEIRPDGERVLHPLTDYQGGSIRDDFDFGYLVMLRTADAAAILEESEKMLGAKMLHSGAFYAFRLAASRMGMFLHIMEYMYSKVETDLRASGQKQFDYVNPSNRKFQIEMEQIATAHLVDIGVFLPERKGTVSPDMSMDTDMVATVVIPVKNRAATIMDAVNSALGQETEFPFNVIVVDNHSDDGTTALLAAAAERDSRLVHIIPESRDLMIGGCWNEAVFDVRCGRYAVQLDSDDVYSSADVLRKLVGLMKGENLAMAIGSYQLTDFSLSPIPPGVIDHKEWSDMNGHNNALRINGLGAPRAFDVPVLRSIGGFPDVSYGEDYAVALRISREYRIGRIYDVLYNCRRWEGNSDAALSQEKLNRNNAYKDMLRSLEMVARFRMNHETARNE